MDRTRQYDAFISYRVDLSSRSAVTLGSAIEAVLGPRSVFLDRQELLPGDDWREVLQSRIEAPSLKCLIAIVHSESFSHTALPTESVPNPRPRVYDPDDMVIAELALGFRRQERDETFVVIPVFEDADARPPGIELMGAADMHADLAYVVGRLRAIDAVKSHRLSDEGGASAVAEIVRRQVVWTARLGHPDFPTLVPFLRKDSAVVRRRIRIAAAERLAEQGRIEDVALCSLLDVATCQFDNAVAAIRSETVSQIMGHLRSDDHRRVAAAATCCVALAIGELGGRHPRDLPHLRLARELMNDVLLPSAARLHTMLEWAHTHQFHVAEFEELYLLTLLVIEHLNAGYFVQRGIPYRPSTFTLAAGDDGRIAASPVLELSYSSTTGRTAYLQPATFEIDQRRSSYDTTLELLEHAGVIRTDQ